MAEVNAEASNEARRTHAIMLITTFNIFMFSPENKSWARLYLLEFLK
jgi:hypothetical protein